MVIIRESKIKVSSTAHNKDTIRLRFTKLASAKNTDLRFLLYITFHYIVMGEKHLDASSSIDEHQNALRSISAGQG